jgi:hypothetical protein
VSKMVHKLDELDATYIKTFHIPNEKMKVTPKCVEVQSKFQFEGSKWLARNQVQFEKAKDGYYLYVPGSLKWKLLNLGYNPINDWSDLAANRVLAEG